MNKQLAKKIQAFLLAFALVCMLMPTMTMRAQGAEPSFSTHYNASMAFDCQRNPAYPEEGQDFTVSGLSSPYNKDGVNSGLGDTYLMLVYLGTYGVVTGADKPTSLPWNLEEASLTNAPVVKLVQYQSDGTLMGDFSKPGILYILDDNGSYFFDGSGWGYFLSGTALDVTAKTFGGTGVGGLVTNVATLTTSSVDKSALTAAISTATDYYNSIQASYADIASTLNTAIATAQAVADNTSATEQDVADAVTALNTAKGTAESAVAAIAAPAANADYYYANCYDCQRNPAFPMKGQECVASGFSNPLVGYETTGTTSSANWSLTYVGFYKDYTNLSDHIAEVVSGVGSAYQLSSFDNVPIYELKNGSTHVAYGSLCALADNNGKALFIGDTWAGGAGYVLSTDPLDGSYTFTITTDITDIIADKTGASGGQSTPDPDPDPDSETTPTQGETKIPYEEVATTSGSVTDITNETNRATGETNPFQTNIVNSEDLETLVGVTAAEKAQGVNVWLDIKDASNTVPEADKATITEVAGDYTMGMYIDVTLFKKVGSNPEEKVTETNGQIQFSLVIPESLRKSGRTFALGKVHNGVGSVLEGVLDLNTFTFTVSTSEFSSYAILYTDETTTAPTTPTASTGTTTASTKTATSTATAATTAAPTAAPSAASPKTGEEVPYVCILLMMISALLASSAVPNRRR